MSTTCRRCDISTAFMSRCTPDPSRNTTPRANDTPRAPGTPRATPAVAATPRGETTPRAGVSPRANATPRASVVPRVTPSPRGGLAHVPELVVANNTPIDQFVEYDPNEVVILDDAPAASTLHEQGDPSLPSTLARPGCNSVSPPKETRQQATEAPGKLKAHATFDRVQGQKIVSKYLSFDRQRLPRVLESHGPQPAEGYERRAHSFGRETAAVRREQLLRIEKQQEDKQQAEVAELQRYVDDHSIASLEHSARTALEEAGCKPSIKSDGINGAVEPANAPADGLSHGAGARAEALAWLTRKESENEIQVRPRCQALEWLTRNEQAVETPAQEKLALAPLPDGYPPGTAPLEVEPPLSGSSDVEATGSRGGRVSQLREAIDGRRT